MKKLLLILLLIIMHQGAVQAQSIAIGAEGDVNVYQRYANPTKGNFKYSSSGQILTLVPALGVKTWFSFDKNVFVSKFAFSIESKVEYSPYAFNYKASAITGAMCIPVTFKLNFLSTFDDGIGFYIGGGPQWTNAELYEDSDHFFKTYNAEFGLLFTALGDNDLGEWNVPFSIFIRYGQGLNNSTTLNIGLSFGFARVL